MNAMLLQLIAARVGSSGNPQLVDMIARMNSGEAMPAIDPQELLARFGDNPAVKMLLQQMATQQAEVSGNAEGRVIEGEFIEQLHEEEGTEDSKGRASEINMDVLQDLQREIDHVSTEIAVLRERMTLLAAALGACPLCWGEHSACPGCRGRGSAGFSMPDEKLFREYVAPAVRTFRALKMSSQGRTN